MGSINVNNYVSFVSLLPTNKFSLSTYEDHVGNKFFIHSGSLDQNGNPVPFKFKFTRSKRHLQFHKDKTDQNGINYVWFLRNHPRCLGSKFNLPKEMCWFKEEDSEKDAEIIIQSYENRNKAETYALNLKGAEFDRVASVLGFVGPKAVVHQKLIHYASKDPIGFLEKVKDPNMIYEALMRDALSTKVISKRGFRFTYNDIHLGNSEEDVIKRLAEDKDLRAVIQKSVGLAGKS